MLEAAAPEQQGEHQHGQVGPLGDRRHADHVEAEAPGAEQRGDQRHGAAEVGPRQQIDQSHRQAADQGDHHLDRDVGHSFSPRSGPGQRVHGRQHPGEARRVEGDAVVVEPAVDQGAGVLEKGFRIPLVEDGVGPAPVLVRAQEGQPVHPGEQGEAQRPEGIANVAIAWPGGPGGLARLPFGLAALLASAQIRLSLEVGWRIAKERGRTTRARPGWNRGRPTACRSDACRRRCRGR